MNRKTRKADVGRARTWGMAGTAALMMACSPAMTPWPRTADDPQVLEVGLERALAAIPGGVALEVEREAEPAEVHVEVWDGTSVVELVFDATNGQLTGRAPEELSDEERAALPTLVAAVAAQEAALGEALSRARERHGGAVLEVELTLEGGGLVVEVEVEGGGSDQFPLR